MIHDAGDFSDVANKNERIGPFRLSINFVVMLAALQKKCLIGEFVEIEFDIVMSGLHGFMFCACCFSFIRCIVTLHSFSAPDSRARRA